MKLPGKLQRFMLRIAAAFVVAGALAWSVAKLDLAYPPPLAFLPKPSVEVVARDGRLLRVFANGQGRWQMQADLEWIDPEFLAMLIAYEDKRFYGHFGVDPLAMARAAAQLVWNGNVVSGASTITMQVARLIEPRQSRSLTAKLRQMIRAVQIERRLNKTQILTLYLSLAPYGGNIEGVRGASLAWFGKEPAHLSLEEAALLVSLPQSPEARRPDRNPQEALEARNRVVARMIDAGLVPEGEAKRSAAIAVPRRKREMPRLAAHLARAAIDRDPGAVRHATTLDAALQSRLERLSAEAAARIGDRVSVAIVVADIASGEIRAAVGSPGFDDYRRSGYLDMTRASRSPGSTLKPVIYGLAIEEGLVLPETIIGDRPADFGGYRPANFDGVYRGDVPVRTALQLSLNIPAVTLLDALGPARMLSRLKRAGVVPKSGGPDRIGLGIALGGVSLTLRELVQIYVNLVSQAGAPVAIGDGIVSSPGRLPGPPMLRKVAAWHVADMLAGTPRPAGTRDLDIAYKTGTSYGFRDAWSVGYDGRYVIGVWAGRPDNGAVPGMTGIGAAAPVLFEAFAASGADVTPLPAAPAGAVRLTHNELPQSLRFFKHAASSEPSRPTGERLQIVFPPNGSMVETTPLADGSAMPVVIKLQGGVPPFRLLLNGRPADTAARRRQIQWQPSGRGTQRLTVLDSMGQAKSVAISVD